MKNVLIVDDEERYLLSIQSGFTVYKNQLNIITATNGKKAIEVLDSESIDLVITDLKMPEMDGFELLAYIASHFSSIPTIVMTAFGTEDVESKIKKMGTLKLLEKPIDFDQLANAIFKCLELVTHKGQLTGISLASFLQIIEMEGKTCLLEIQGAEPESGLFYFQKGAPYSAIYKNMKGEKAALEMLKLGAVKISIKQTPSRKFAKQISTSLMTLLMDVAKDKDDAFYEESGEDESDEIENEVTDAKMVTQNPSQKDSVDLPATKQAPSAKKRPNKPQKEELKKHIIEQLEKFKDVGGFQAVGVFSPQGELANQVNISGYKLEEVGAYVNEIFLKTQRTTEIIGMGKSQMIHIAAPHAQIIVRCLDEVTNATKASAGSAHIHMILILDADSNLAIGKMKLKAVIQEIVSCYR